MIARPLREGVICLVLCLSLATFGAAQSLFEDTQGSTSQVIMFRPVVSYPAGAMAHGVVVSDLNDDGLMDLIITVPGDNAVSILMGLGAHRFMEPILLPTGQTPKQSVVTDLNGDGRKDIVTANQDSMEGEDVSVLLQLDDGSFAPAMHFQACDHPHQVAVGDLDADGVADVAVACWGEPNIAVLRGSGDGSFADATFVDSGGNAPHGLVITDFDGDGIQDIAVAALGSSVVSVLIANGEMTFQSANTFDTGSSPHSIKTFDLDGDSWPDIVTPNQSSNDVSVLRNLGDGTFESSRYPTGLTPKDVAIGDIDGDGIPDIVTANIHENYPDGTNPTDVSVLYGVGDGTFLAPSTFPIELTPFGVTVADVDGDRFLDIVTANWHTNDATVLYNTGLGDFLLKAPRR